MNTFAIEQEAQLHDAIRNEEQLVMRIESMPRTIDEAVQIFTEQNGTAPYKTREEMEVLRWFFDIGKASGLHNATKHLGPHVRTTRSTRADPAGSGR